MLRIIFMTLVLVAFISCKGKTDNTQNKAIPTNSRTEVSKPTEMPIASTEEKDVITSDNMSSLQFGKCKIDGSFEKSIIDCEDTIDEFKFIYKNGTKAKRFLVSDLPSDENGKIRFLKLNDHSFEVYGVSTLSDVTEVSVVSDKSKISVLHFIENKFKDQQLIEESKYRTPKLEETTKVEDPYFEGISHAMVEGKKCKIFGKITNLSLECSSYVKHTIVNVPNYSSNISSEIRDGKKINFLNLPSDRGNIVIEVAFTTGESLFLELSIKNGKVIELDLEEAQKRVKELL